MQLLLGVGEAAGQRLEVGAVGHLAPPEREALAGRGADAIVADMAPERRVVALGDVVEVNEVAEVVDLAGDEAL